MAFPTLVTGEESLLDALKLLQANVERGGMPGLLLVTDAEGVLRGSVTDGDIRRALVADLGLATPVGEICNPDPIHFSGELSREEILKRLPSLLAERGRQDGPISKIVLTTHEGRPTDVIEFYELLRQRMAGHRSVAVIGLGYVGLTLAVALADAGFVVTGVESDPEKVRALLLGESYVEEEGIDVILADLIERKQLQIGRAVPGDCDVYIITVGTPVIPGATGPKVISTYVEEAAESVGRVLSRGDLVILRSTLPVGETRLLAEKYLEPISGLDCRKEFGVAFAPERTAEGVALKELRELPQIIGALSEDALESTVALFRAISPHILRASSVEAAELAKLANNTYRDVTFGFANELARVCHEHGVSTGEVVDLANIGYKRGGLPKPSPGVGGPCLTKDPYIFASHGDLSSSLALVGRRSNEIMPSFVVSRILEILRTIGCDPEKVKLVVAGLAFKGEPETGDLRSSTGVTILELLAEHVPNLGVFDPVADLREFAKNGFLTGELPNLLEGASGLIIANNHRFFGSSAIPRAVMRMGNPSFVFDSWGLMSPSEIVHSGSEYFSL